MGLFKWLFGTPPKPRPRQRRRTSSRGAVQRSTTSMRKFSRFLKKAGKPYHPHSKGSSIYR